MNADLPPRLIAFPVLTQRLGCQDTDCLPSDEVRLLAKRPKSISSLACKSLLPKEAHRCAPPRSQKSSRLRRLCALLHQMGSA